VLITGSILVTLGAILIFFALQGRCVEPIGVKFGVEKPNLTPIGAGVWGPKTENFAKISAYKCPTEAYPLGDFYQIVGSFMCSQLLKFVQIQSWVSEFWRFKFRDVRITSNFKRPLAVKLCVRGEHVLEVQARYGPLSPCKVWWGSDIALHQG